MRTPTLGEVKKLAREMQLINGRAGAQTGADSQVQATNNHVVL